MLSSPAALADPQTQASDQSAAPPPAATEADSDYNGQDFTRPQRSIETRALYRTSSGAASETDRETLLLRTTFTFDLQTGWRLGVFAQAPISNRTVTTFNPFAASTETGLADAIAQAALSHSIDQHWAYGFGLRLVAPTAEDSLGLGKWQVMPGFGLRYSFLELGPDTYFVPVIRYAMSVAGDPLRRNIREPQIAPTLNIGLPDGWFLTLYPSNDIRINFGDPVSGQTGRLFLPLDASFGREFENGLVMSLEVGVPIIKEYPVYDLKTELRMVLRF